MNRERSTARRGREVITGCGTHAARHAHTRHRARRILLLRVEGGRGERGAVFHLLVKIRVGLNELSLLRAQGGAPRAAAFQRATRQVQMFGRV